MPPLQVLVSVTFVEEGPRPPTEAPTAAMLIAGRPGRLAAALAAVLLLAGCGGQGMLSKKALSQEAKGVQSLASEGTLLADDAARGRSTSTFTRIHARFLEQAARSSRAKLARGQTPKGRRLAQLAARVNSDLERLSRSGSDHATQRRLQQDLAQAADAISKLGKSL